MKPFLVLRSKATGQVYMTRWALLVTPLFGVYLHRLTSPDPDRDLHNHPWDGITIVLLGGYTQRTKLGLERVSWWQMLGAKYHRITQLSRKPTWTVVVRGRRKREWGFLVKGEHVEWRQYIADIQQEEQRL